MLKTAYDQGERDALDHFKVATVPGAVKQYRRAMTGFGEATRSIREAGRDQATRGWALHGTPALAGIVGDRTLEASPLGPKGQYGSGAYFWRGFPKRMTDESYLQVPTEEGFATDLATLPNKRPPQPNLYGGGSSNMDSIVSGPNNYAIRPKDTAIIDTATRAKNKTLGPLTADAQDARMRTVDSAIFQRARRQTMRSNANKSIPAPTKQELIALLRRRQAGISE